MILSCLADILYPRRCPVCDSVIGRNTGLVCGKCISKIRFIDPGYLKNSGTDEEGRRIIRSASGHAYDDFAAAFEYKNEMRKSVLRFKYSGRAEYKDFYCAALWAVTERIAAGWKADLIVPVPCDAGRQRQRGYNQAELLAAGISRLSGIPVDAGCIRRVKSTRPQSGLDPIQRRINLAGAFRSLKSVPERVIVIDDILTTGSTMDAAAACLKNAGAVKVFALCLCAD